ncbi:hypothetical protein AB0J72_35970 [Dactylosporangium sp. NPDC049742]|uniref:hypothetical protein n=1 Tax=Dactylosporangium sp. NPDC049742 TaxID=3154737 RepID=UPI0034455CE1
MTDQEFFDEHRRRVAEQTAVARAMVAAGADADQVAAELLRRDGSPIVVIRALHDASGLGLGDAKWVVHRNLDPEYRAVHERFWAEAVAGLQQEALAEVLVETRAWLARPDNDFARSSFLDGEAAAEVDLALSVVRAGGTPAGLRVLFAPTGPIQEVAFSSGWGDEFIDLADRFDAAMDGR